MSKCEAKNRNGKQCLNNSLTGSKFCRVHQTFNISLKQRIWKGLKENIKALLAIPFLIGTLIGLYQIYLYFQDKKQNTTSGVITNPQKITSTPQNTTKKSIVVNTIRFDVYADEAGVLLDNGKPVFSVRTVNNKLLVTASVRNSRGDLVAEIKDNVWSHQDRPVIYDRNYTDNIFEVKDNTGKVILQVVDFGDALSIAGIFPCSNGEAVYFGSDGETGAKVEPLAKGQEASIEIQPICKYPSSLYLGICPGVEKLRKMYYISKNNPPKIAGEGGFIDFCR